MKIMKTVINIFLVIIFNFITQNCYSETCSVINIYDGDTIEVKCQKYSGVLNLYNIDAPEINQDFGEEALVFLSELICKDKIHGDIYNYDKEIDIFINGRSLSSYLVSNGYAWAKERKRSEKNWLLKLEETSKKNELNMWANKSIEAPWVFRERNHILSDKDMGYDLLVRASSGITKGGSQYSVDKCDKLEGGDAYLCKQRVIRERMEAQKAIEEDCSKYKPFGGAASSECMKRNVATKIDWDRANPYRSETK